jgi:uncharacterized repeat protein (TIGR01451 family)
MFKPIIVCRWFSFLWGWLLCCLMVVQGATLSTAQSQAITPQPCSPRTILFVSAKDRPPKEDRPLVESLRGLGHQVDTIAAAQVQASHASGKDLVIISATALSSEVNTRLRDIPVPLLTWEGWLLDDLQMTGGEEAVAYGEAVAQAITITNPTHPLAGGLTGEVQTTRNPEEYHWGVPGPNALVIATTDQPPRAFLFAYETGVEMVGLVAPARRLFLQNAMGPKLTANGWLLFDAAVQWVMNCPVSPPPTSTASPTPSTTPDQTPTPPTITPTPPPATSAQLAVTKRDFFFADADQNDLVSAGDTVLYTIQIVNQGSTLTPRLRLEDALDPNTTLVPGSVRVIGGVVVQGNGAQDEQVIVEITPLISGANATVSLQALVVAAESQGQLHNQAVVHLLTDAGQPSDQPPLHSDDPDTATPQDATITPLLESPAQPPASLFLPMIGNQSPAP